jgi:hypothetical protein
LERKDAFEHPPSGIDGHAIPTNPEHVEDCWRHCIYGVELNAVFSPFMTTLKILFPLFEMNILKLAIDIRLFCNGYLNRNESNSTWKYTLPTKSTMAVCQSSIHVAKLEDRPLVLIQRYPRVSHDSS